MVENYEGLWNVIQDSGAWPHIYGTILLYYKTMDSSMYNYFQGLM